MFITSEDEGVNANLIIWPNLFEDLRRIVMGARLLGAYGLVQRQGNVIDVIAKRLTDLFLMLSPLGGQTSGLSTRLAAVMVPATVADGTRAANQPRRRRRATSISRRFTS